MWRNKLYHLWCFVALYSIVLQNQFFAIYAVLSQNWLSRFTRFCVEKNLAKKCACGEKMTNTRYASLSSVSLFFWKTSLLCLQLFCSSPIFFCPFPFHISCIFYLFFLSFSCIFPIFFNPSSPSCALMT